MYKLGNYKFNLEEFFPKKLFEKITDVRVEGAAETILMEECGSRSKRGQLTNDGKLTILAADHPARLVTKNSDNQIGMGNRYEYLGRILRVITNEEFDGIMGTPDVLEELLIVDYLHKEKSGKSFLDDKVMIGCMNRGGLAGTVFEMDDKFTAYDAKTINEMSLDGAKLMFRLDPKNADCGKTISYCSKAINELNEKGLSIFLEPLPVEKTEAGYKTKKSFEDIIKVNGVATALGSSSANIWLKIPYVKNFKLVSLSTTCPILMLGGESKGNPTPLLKDFAKGMKAGKNVRGTLVGRNVLFPGNEDPMAVAEAVNKIVHQKYTPKKAIQHLMKVRGKNMNYFKKWKK